MKRSYNQLLPSYNEQIHKDNPYFNNPPDFKKLAIEYPSLNDFITDKGDGSVGYQFSKKNASKTLTKVLMKNDFNLDWDIPENHLSPGLTGRINYLNEIHELLAACPTNNVKGIDIGTGASCIYPLLGNALYKWNFIATDIDPESIHNANHLIEMNHLSNAIQCIQRNKDDFLLKDLVNSSISFTMCNPPFFEHVDEMEPNPNSHTNMTTNESITEGGEVAFIKRMIEEASLLPMTPTLFTSLVGRKKSIKPLLAFIKEKGFPFMGTFVLYQGKTLRWCICWTHNELYGNYMEHNPLHYKVFAKKKFKHMQLQFQLNVNEVRERMDSFCSRCEGVEGDWNGNEWILKIYDFRYVPPTSQPSNSIKGSLQAILRFILEKGENVTVLYVQYQDPVNLSLTSKVLEQLENDIRRDNRRWRRFLQLRDRYLVCSLLSKMK